MKSKRQAEILRIIEDVDVETQDQLLSELKARGLTSTQATISRDLKHSFCGNCKWRFQPL